MKSVGIIPARYGSSRFPGKPLALIAGRPMIEWVYKRAKASKLDYVVVATDDERIFNCVEAFGGMAVMTRTDHETGTDRLQEAVEKLSEKLGEFQIVINVQGDEPLIDKALIDALIEMMKQDENVPMGTLMHEISDITDVDNPNVVKVICDKNLDALYFSRCPIPYNRAKSAMKYFRHLGIYAYRKSFLKTFTELAQSRLEKLESLEQLRALENGYKIRVLEAKTACAGVDTPEDLVKIESFIQERGIKLD